MGGVISDGGQDWFLAGHEYRQVLSLARGHVQEPGDLGALDQAEALQGLYFDLLEADQAQRLAEAVRLAACQLDADLRQKPILTAREAGFRDLLPALIELATRWSAGRG